MLDRSPLLTLFKPPVFNPHQFGDDLMFWYDGQDPRGDGSVPSSGAAINPWVDKSANAISVPQGTGSRQATFVPNIINGRPALRFNSGATQFYQRAAVRVFDNVNSYSIFVIFRPNSVAITNGFLEGGNGTGTGIFAIGATSGRIRLVNRSPYAISGGDDITSANNAMTAGANYFVKFVRNGATGNQTVISSNGITANLTPLTQPGLPAADMLLTIGTNGASIAGALLNGWVGAIIGVAKVLSASEMAGLSNYVWQRWGITT